MIKETAKKLQDENYKPSSQSLIEKRIQKFKKQHVLKTAFRFCYYLGQLENK